MTSVWAQHRQFGTACPDGSDGAGRFPAGSADEQFGWDVGITFDTLSDLAAQLDPRGPSRRSPTTRACGPEPWIGSAPRCGLRPGEVTRLAILSHGAPGQLFVNGSAPTSSGSAPTSGTDPLTAGSARDPARHKPFLLPIGLATSSRAWIYLMGCNCARGPEGEQFLCALSREWPGRTIVGYTFYGGRRAAPGSGSCLLPGMRDMGGTNGGGSVDSAIAAAPWASDVSPGAIHARDGRIVNRIMWNSGVDHAPGPVTRGIAPRRSTRRLGTLGVA